MSLCFDKKGLAAFCSTGKGCQVRINDTLVRSATRLGMKLVYQPRFSLTAPLNQFFTTLQGVTGARCQFHPQLILADQPVWDP